jgi:pseudaminic acid synthase
LKEIHIGTRIISEGSSALIVAELSANHNNELKIALESIRAIKDAGADAVKVQTYRPDSITIDSDKGIFQTRKDSHWPGRKLYDLYKKGSLPYEWHEELKSLAEGLGLIFFSTPFDHQDVDFLESLDVPAYKIASLEINDIPLISYVAEKGKPIILSTGIAKVEDIQLAVNTCQSKGNDQIIILKCTSSYPTPPEEANLLSMQWLKDTFDVLTGLSDHTLGIYAPITAISLGAKFIEKHFVLDKNLKSLDADFSLDPDEFSKMVFAIRETEKLLGNYAYSLTQKMEMARKSMRSIFIIRDVKKGERFTRENIKSIRPGNGLHPKHFYNILGKKAAKDLEAGTPLSFNDITG